MKISLFGGSFDPPHHGHFTIAEILLEQKKCDQVWFVPCAQHPYGKKLSPAKKRITALQDKIDATKNEQMHICMYELEKSTTSYSIETLEYLDTKYPEHNFSWVIGSDQVADFDKWHRYEDILSAYTVYVYPRPGYTVDTLPKGMELIQKARKVSMSSTVARKMEDTKTFISDTFSRIGIDTAVIAVSGGVDSAVSLTLSSQALSPENVFALLLPYGDQDMQDAQSICEWNNIPKENIQVISISTMVDAICAALNIQKNDALRRGNVMARARMIAVYDFAKKKNALVVGTENKSEHYLGYFTRFGDEASDLEPLISFYKTDVYALAEYLQLPSVFIKKPPSAGLWLGQTDEKELGFGYEEADVVLASLIDKNVKVEDLLESGIDDISRDVIEKVVHRYKSQSFKRKVPYCLE